MNREKLKELIDDIQAGGDLKWCGMVKNFPDTMKGSIAQEYWQDSMFTYGMEYGALIILNYLLDEKVGCNSNG